jgi:hypothetical protein
MCSFRIEPRLKEQLQIIAQKRDHSLSSLIEQAVKDFLESQESDFQVPATPEDRRQHPRKEVLLPARWRLRRGKDRVEHDVLIKNISGGGAYTEYMNGRVYRIFENDQSSSLELIVRLPGSQEHVVFECEPKRFHVTKESVGVGLRYTKLTDRKSLVALTGFLT